MKILAVLSLAFLTSQSFAFVPGGVANARLSFLKSSAEAETSAADTSAGESESNTHNLDPEFLAAYQKVSKALEAAAPKKELLEPLLYFAREYLSANQASLKAGNEECTPQQTAARFLKAVELGVTYGMGENKYLFGSSHVALRGNPETEDGNTYDYYKFGNDFFRPCMDVANSVVLGRENLKEAMEYLEKGENVVFLANHQSEADPQVVSTCLEIAGYGQQAANMVYVAGHKVTTDPLAIPFSMGRNLICIHSKKHIDSDPEMKPVKQRQNLAAMGAMLDKLRKGGTALWVAPSGGRDRRNVETGEIPLAPFDSKTIDMFRLMGNKSKIPTHYYPLAMVSYELCPPPDYVVAGVGEERNVRFVPVGVFCGKELKSEGGLEGRHEFCEHAMQNCQADYEALLAELETNMRK